MSHILFVCLGNICRSPTAEAVFRKRAEVAGLSDLVIDSAGTGNWHIGSPPDHRATAAAAHRGYDLTPLRARQVTTADFDTFSHIIAMDRQNLADLEAMAPSGHTAKLSLFLDGLDKGHDVPDPYFGGGDGFDHVLDLVEMASDALIADLKSS